MDVDFASAPCVPHSISPLGDCVVVLTGWHDCVRVQQTNSILPRHAWLPLQEGRILHHFSVLCGHHHIRRKGGAGEMGGQDLCMPLRMNMKHYVWQRLPLGALFYPTANNASVEQSRMPLGVVASWLIYPTKTRQPYFACQHSHGVPPFELEPQSTPNWMSTAEALK